MRRAAGALALAWVVLLTVTACTSADEAAFDMEDVLHGAGFDNVYVNHEEVDLGFIAYVDFDSDATNEDTLEAEQRRAAEMTWDALRLRLVKVDVAAYDVPYLGGLPARTESYLRADLERAFGPRPTALDEDVAHASETAVGLHLPWWIAAVLLVLLCAVAVVVVLLLRRSGRRRRERDWAAHAYWQQGYPPYPPPGGGWGGPG